MGVYIGLDVMPNKIYQEDWQRVFEESMQLIQAYPFATLKEENVNGFKRFVLDRAEGQYVEGYGGEGRYWKVNGDLDSKETGEGFTLFSNLDRYSSLKEERLTEDILLNFVNKDERGAKEVFYSKTQGKDYHNFILSIAALIESRFPKSACVYGDITKAQAQKAVVWANTILDKPIDPPVRVNPSKLLERLNVIDNEEKRLEALYNLSIGDSEEVDGHIAKNFNMDTVRNYFAKKLQGFESAAQLGAELIIIRYLNAGLPLENLIDICCFDNNGPQFGSIEFVKAICSSWVFIEPEIRENMNATIRPSDLPDTVESQFGSMFLDMGFMGRKNRRYIPKNEILLILKEKFQDVSGLEEVVIKQYQKIVDMLEKKGAKLKVIEEEYKVKVDLNLIDSLDELVFWDNSYSISDSLIRAMTTIKDAVEEGIAKRTNLMQIIGEAEEEGQLIKVLSKLMQENQNLVLTRPAWDWIENATNDVKKQMVVMLLSFESNGELRKLYKALFENKGWFYKYMI